MLKKPPEIKIDEFTINCDLNSDSVGKTYPDLPYNIKNWENFKEDVKKRNEFLKNLDNDAYNKIKSKFPDFKPPK